MRLTLAVALLASTAVSAQDATITLPTGNFGNYDPTMSAKEAVLANWEMAASGVRAGEVLGKQVVDLVDRGSSFDYLASQAAFAQETMVSRYNAAAWLFFSNPDAVSVSDATLRAIVEASAQSCDAAVCTAETAAIRAAFSQAADELGAASVAARAAITERQGRVDAALMAEQLGIVADYLESGAWAEDLVLTEYGMDAEVVADRIVGTVALWRNVEPYVGITDQEIDNAINAATQNLLRTLRRETRGLERLDPDSQVLADLTAAAGALAVEFRRASALFAS